MTDPASTSARTDVIDVRGLTFRYPGSPRPALQDMNFAVGPGEIFGFLGPSGSGKSTTQKLLIGLLRGHGGDVSVWGREPTAWGPRFYEIASREVVDFGSGVVHALRSTSHVER